MRKILAALLVTCSLSGLIVAINPGVAGAVYNPFAQLCSEGGAGSAACQTNGKDPITGAEGKGALVLAVQIIAFVTGIVAVFAIVFAGSSYILANGEPAKAAKAKDVIVYSAIGLAIALSAGTLSQYLANKF